MREGKLEQENRRRGARSRRCPFIDQLQGVRNRAARISLVWRRMPHPQSCPARSSREPSDAVNDAKNQSVTDAGNQSKRQAESESNEAGKFIPCPPLAAA